MSRPQRILGVVGARPQFVKAAAIHRAWKQHADRHSLQIKWLHTGQHYDPMMSDVFFSEFRLPAPDFLLRPSRASAPEQFADMYQGLLPAIRSFKPDRVLVFGDTNSTLAAALAADFCGIPVAHVEAGLRSFNRAMPEERNRVLTDRLSDLLFCPTEASAAQLRSEGIDRGIHRVGDVMADLILGAASRLRSDKNKEEYYLATIHRNTNTDDLRRLGLILSALDALDLPVRMPLHPRTAACIQKNAALRKRSAGFKNLRISAPQPYGEMMRLIQNAQGVVTDSGGVQKEAFWLGTPCVTLREETEWVETVRLGRNRLCRPDAAAIQKSFRSMRRSWAKQVPPVYGEGDTSEKILAILNREKTK
jgi:UDP-GlcNAc3NAcA epimerase